MRKKMTSSSSVLNPARSKAAGLPLARPSCWRTSPSPSPRPSPLGRGRHLFPLSEQRGAADWLRTGDRSSLSSGERAGVRGKEPFDFPKFAPSKRGSRLPITLRSTLSSSFLAGLVIGSSVLAAEIDESKLPPPATNRIDFARDIKPIFESSCFRCHGVERPKSKYSLATRESALKGGENGVDILPGQSAKSPLIHYVSGLAEDIEMPPKGKGDPLTSEQIGLLRAWIDQGVQWSAPEPPPEPQLTM